MRRRGFLAAVSAGIGLAGCLAGPGDPTGQSRSPTTTGETPTAMRRTADGITATFRVLDGHMPTDDTASATFAAETVTVTGTMDPSGCNRPTLTAVRYHAADGLINLVIGGESPYGKTATVECGNASYDYRCKVSVSQGDPEAVDVVHNYDGKDNKSFTLVQE